MIIKSIKLVNFRNHAQYSLECTDQTSLILGANGCGKTSVLEAIYILTRGKSFRATDPEIIKRDTDFYRIELTYQNGEVVTATYDGSQKFFTAMDKKSKRLPTKHKYPIILFLPSDLNLISHSPGRRRDYFDAFFGELNHSYASDISKYKKAIRQRNEILKKDTTTAQDLFPWNILIARLGVNICRFRQQYTNQINQLLKPTYHSIAENNDTIQLSYQSEAEGLTEDAYLRRLEQNFQRDFYLGRTTFGIHHDDFIFEFNGKLANGSASRGETRSIILALKFTEAKLIQDTLHQKPLILLDDVFSELDNTRRQCLVDNFKDHQVIITSVEKIDKNF